MAKEISKNARSGSRTNINLCRCGGVVEMRSRFENGKLKHYAECTGACKKTARRPKDLK